MQICFSNLGLKAELSVLEGRQEPLEQMVENLKRTLDSTKNILIQKHEIEHNERSNNKNDDIRRYSQVWRSSNVQDLIDNKV